MACHTCGTRQLVILTCPNCLEPLCNRNNCSVKCLECRSVILCNSCHPDPELASWEQPERCQRCIEAETEWREEKEYRERINRSQIFECATCEAAGAIFSGECQLESCDNICCQVCLVDGVCKECL